MNTCECIKARRSIRIFSDKPVSRGDIGKIVETASFAPSWKNSQTAGYTAITDAALKNRIADECTLGFEHNRGIIKNAPVLIAETSLNGISGCEADGSFSTSKNTHWQSFDAGIAAEAFCLAAFEYGLSTLIMGIFDEEEVKKVLGLPQEISVSALIALGYSDKTPEAPKRKSVNELLSFR